MNKFDLEKALSGEKVITRDGREVTQLTVFSVHDAYLPLVGVVNEKLSYWALDGTDPNSGNLNAEIFMAPKRLSGFVNVYSDPDEDSTFTVHSERRYADKVAGSLRVACIDLSQFNEGHGL